MFLNQFQLLNYIFACPYHEFIKHQAIKSYDEIDLVDNKIVSHVISYQFKRLN